MLLVLLVSLLGKVDPDSTDDTSGHGDVKADLPPQLRGDFEDNQPRPSPVASARSLTSSMLRHSLSSFQEISLWKLLGDIPFERLDTVWDGSGPHRSKDEVSSRVVGFVIPIFGGDGLRGGVGPRHS